MYITLELGRGCAKCDDNESLLCMCIIAFNAIMRKRATRIKDVTIPEKRDINYIDMSAKLYEYFMARYLPSDWLY